MRTQVAVKSGRKQPYPTCKSPRGSVQTHFLFPYSCRTCCHGDTAQYLGLSFCARLISHGFISHKEWKHFIWILSLVDTFRCFFCFCFFAQDIGLSCFHMCVKELKFHVSTGFSALALELLSDKAHEWLRHPEAPGSLLLGENSSVDLHRRGTVTCIRCLMILMLFENINVKHYHYG